MKPLRATWLGDKRHDGSSIIESINELSYTENCSKYPPAPLSATNKSGTRIGDHTYSLLSSYYNKTKPAVLDRPDRGDDLPREGQLSHRDYATATINKKIIVTFDLLPGIGKERVENPEEAQAAKNAYMTARGKRTDLNNSSRNIGPIGEGGSTSSKSSRVGKTATFKSLSKAAA